MKYAIIISQKDLAGLNIKQTLIEFFNFKETQEQFGSSKVYEKSNTKLYTTQKDSVDCENIDKEIEADFFIFATKHQSKNNIPSLSVHTQGNWGKAEYGGQDKKLCVAPACYLKKALIQLDKLTDKEQFEIIQECTHHGPFMKKLSMFIEIGSTPEQWNSKKAAKIIAQTILHITENPPIENKSAIGIGGLHHTPSFKKIILNTEIAIGHVCPKYQLENLDKQLVEQAINKTIPKPKLVILDWKGLGAHKQKVMSILDEIGIEVKRTKQF